MLPSKATRGRPGGMPRERGPPYLLGVQVVPCGAPSVDVGQQPLMVSGRQRPAGAERAESTSPLLRGFSSQWGGGGCLPRPESPSNPAAIGLLAFPPRPGQAGRGRFGGGDGGGCQGWRVGAREGGSAGQGHRPTLQ